MGVVYLAYHETLQTRFAVKILAPELAQNNNYVQRFLQEARTAARIIHPNIVRVFDCGATGASYYMTMEYVDGRACDRLLRERGTLTEHEALRIAVAIARALVEAGRHGIVHRDIKPANIILTSDGMPKLADLGLAKDVRTSGAKALTGSDHMLGTPYYIAPEQAESPRHVGPRADIYSLGATLYHFVTGRMPFDGETATEIMLKHIREPLPPPRDVNPNVSGRCAEVIEKMMEKDPGRRQQSATELLDDLQAVLAEITGDPSDRKRGSDRARTARRTAVVCLASAACAAALYALAGRLLPRIQARPNATQVTAADRTGIPAPTPDEGGPGKNANPPQSGERDRELAAVTARLAERATALVDSGKVLQAATMYETYSGRLAAETRDARLAAARPLQAIGRRLVEESLARTGEHRDVYDFTTPGLIRLLVEDGGMKASVESGVCVISGTTRGPEWCVNGVSAPLLDQGKGLDVSVRFMWTVWEDAGCLVLHLDGCSIGPLIVMCQTDGTDVRRLEHGYLIQSSWANAGKDLLEGRGRLPLAGNEHRKFSSLRIHVHENRRDVEFFGGTQLIGRLRFDQDISRINRVRTYFQTAATGRLFRIVLDDLTIRQHEVVSHE